MALETYNKKRNFAKTPEPKGKKIRNKKNLYVIQKHAASHLHYDFRLELNGVLLSWAIPKGPSLDPTVKRLAVHVEDHPVEYGGFEGIIPKGQYGGGTVMLWDKGKWICEDDSPVKAYQKGHLHFLLQGQKLKGRWNLIRFKRGDDKNWFLLKSKDDYAVSENKFDITKEEPDSVLSKMSVDEISESAENVWTKKGLKKQKKKIPKIKLHLVKSSFPKNIFPQLATLVNKPPVGTKWLHEIKFDGYRILAFKDGNKVRLMSRNQKDWTLYFPSLVAELKKIPIKKIIFDGEVVVLDKNQRSDFQLLQNAIKGEHKPHFYYYIFDLLYYDQFNLMTLPLLERKKILHGVIPSNVGPVLRYSDHIIGSGEEVFEKSCEMALEGIISKASDSIYEEKRTRAWLKTKCIKRQEFVVGGFTKPKGMRENFGALLIGYFNQDKELVYAGRVGTGFNQNSLKKIYDLLQKNKINKNPFNSKPPGITSIQWTKPKLVAEIEFSEWTNEGILRHPSFKGLRSDKPPAKIKKEKTVDVEKISKSKADIKSLPFKLTNTNKILFDEDEITKQNLFDFYDSIHQWILQYIANRPLTLVRCPDSYKNCFYQKNLKTAMPDVLKGIPIKLKDKVEKSIYLNSREGLLALVQLGVLEIHPWGSKIESYEFPDMITFDLDPAPDLPWKKVVAAARLIKKYLADYKLKSFVKTTGGKGLHVVVPIKPEYDWSQIKNFSKVFVEYVVSQHPTEFVSVMSKAKRKDKIFLDYLRNQRGATAVAAYSTRAREGAPVSTPLAWDELTDNRNDTAYTIFTLPKRLKKLKKDPWKDFFKIKQSLRLDEI